MSRAVPYMKYIPSYTVYLHLIYRAAKDKFGMTESPAADAGGVAEVRRSRGEELARRYRP